MPIELEGFAEEFQDYIAANSMFTPTLTVGTNFTLGDYLNIQDLEQQISSKILLTLYEEGGSLYPGARRTRQERVFRFLFKGSYGQESMNHCWRMLEWLQNKKTFETTNFKAWLARIDKFPTVIAVGESGTHLADFVVTFNVWCKIE